jgi:imidazole glycerol phosphate synthase glutamine amidotransferase subunit
VTSTKPESLSMNREVLIVHTEVANIASVMAGFTRLGAKVALTESRDEIAKAERVVLPGVGAFGAAMERLRALDLVAALRERFEAGRTTLAVCVGLQLLAAASEESPGAVGLGLFPGPVARFTGPVRVPQLGWNRVEPEPGCALLERGYAYFANSYRLTAMPAGWSGAWADHGGRFVAAMEKGKLLACQFHPELSSGYGRALLTRWLNLGD